MTANPKIVVPFLPSLLHLSAVKVAVPLCNDFDLLTLKIVSRRIEKEIPIKNSEEPFWLKNNRAQEKLLFIPAHLREKVMQTVHGLQYAAVLWRAQHSHILEFKDRDCVCYWMSDGAIDRRKTAQQLIQNTNIDKRFQLACMYCLEDSIQTLWAEMEASDEAENFETPQNSMIHFWVKRMRDVSRAPWRQAAVEYFAPPLKYCVARISRLSCIFPSLRPEDRKRFFVSVKCTKPDDFLLCMQSMTEEEEKEMLEGCYFSIRKLLYIYSEWPLQSVFLETVDKLWNYIDEFSFFCFLDHFFRYMRYRKDFDYQELFEGFWKRCPDHLRKSAKQNPLYREVIDSYLNTQRIIIKKEPSRKKLHQRSSSL